MNTEERRRQLQPYLQLLRAECEKAPENIFDLERRIHLMLLLLLKLLEFSEVCTSKSTHKGEHEHSLQLYLRFVDLLKAHYAKRLSVQDYADKLHTSTRVLAACTHRYENCPPVQTINNFLLAQARRYLLYTPLTIKEIGLKLGFNRPPILSTSFHSGRVYRHRNTGLGSINAQLTQQAIRYLHTTSDSVKEIARKLGFCDASNYVILVSGKTSKSYLTFYLPRTTD